MFRGLGETGRNEDEVDLISQSAPSLCPCRRGWATWHRLRPKASLSFVLLFSGVSVAQGQRCFYEIFRVFGFSLVCFHSALS